MFRILIADDEAAMLRGIELNLQDKEEFDVYTASNKDDARKILVNNEIDLVVSDLMMPHREDGLEVMRIAKEQWYKPTVIAMSAFETVENAVMTMQAGADDFLSKGFGVDELYFRIENLLKRKLELDQLANENKLLKETIQQQFSDYEMIGNSKEMIKVLQRVEKVASDAQVSCLLEGESGVGKDLVARIIHTSGIRKVGPFVPVNCAAIPETLIESELFGHEKGSFTGATSTKPGRFEQASGGIIFLDEIGELPFTLQVRLLRVLEERAFYRIGGKRVIDVDVMVISATNRNLKEMVDKGTFREDLYFRLNVVNIFIPPLRDRQEDIEPLARFFLKKFNQQRKKKLNFSRKALEMLLNYDFPGNVRELRNIIEDAFVFCEGKTILPGNISLQKIGFSPQKTGKLSAQNGPKLEKSLFSMPLAKAQEVFEREYITNILEESMWNQSLASQKAGISRKWLYFKISKLKLKKV